MNDTKDYNSFSFEIPFVKSKLRTRAGMYGVYSPDANKEHMEEIGWLFLEKAKKAGMRGYFPIDAHVGVHLYITAFACLPDSKPKHIQSEPYTTKPDVDNIAKLVMDGLNGVAYHDDKQVIQLHVSKAPRERGFNNHMVVSLLWDKK